MPSPGEVTRLLVAWGNGDQAALDRLIPLVYDELHRLAGRYMRRESRGHTLQTSALINEAYLRPVDHSTRAHLASADPLGQRVKMEFKVRQPRQPDRH